MELPFAVVESPDRSTTLVESNASSLVTASSQGSAAGNNSTTGASLASHHGASSTLPPLNYQPQQHIYTHPKASPPQPTVQTNDFTYVTVCEEDADDDEVDIIIDGGEVATQQQQQQQRGDVLALLLSGETNAVRESFVLTCEQATNAAHEAFRAKDKGNMQHALDAHTRAAKLFRTAATEIREHDASLANSLLLLSKAQASSALALKRILKLLPSSSSINAGDSSMRPRAGSHTDRLVATVRGALGTNKEADISDSMFLGRATSSSSEQQTPEQESGGEEKTETVGTVQHALPSSDGTNNNPVDDMMELEKELRNMDMALELGNSIAFLSTRASAATHGRTMMDGEGSFCVVPGSASYMSSSAMWTSTVSSSNPPRSVVTGGTAGVRARANRVQTVATAPRTAAAVTAAPPPAPHHTTPQLQPPAAKPPHAPGLESSWWGHNSTTMTASQALASSMIGGPPSRDLSGQQQQPADTKQLMRLLDSLKTLGDENAALLREVEDAEGARAEARAARAEMKRFKEQYGTRFEALKAALEKFRMGYPDQQQRNPSNPVSNSNYSRSTMAEEIQEKDRLIRSLKDDLKKEMAESKKKDAALRKYESFYREVKARSAQKAAQRQKQAAAAAAERQRSQAVPPRVPR